MLFQVFSNIIVFSVANTEKVLAVYFFAPRHQHQYPKLTRDVHLQLSVASHRDITVLCLNKYIGIRWRESRFASAAWLHSAEYELRQDPNPRQDGSDKIRCAHSKSNAVMVNSPVSALIQKEE